MRRVAPAVTTEREARSNLPLDRDRRTIRSLMLRTGGATMSEHHEIAQAFRLAEISQQYTSDRFLPFSGILGIGKGTAAPCAGAGENAAVGDAQAHPDTF